MATKLLIINDAVHDITEFIDEHPGGKIIAAYAGKDGTKAFLGAVYYHSNAAHNTLNEYRIGTTLKGDNWAFDPVEEVPVVAHKKNN